MLENGAASVKIGLPAGRHEVCATADELSGTTTLDVKSDAATANATCAPRAK